MDAPMRSIVSPNPCVAAREAVCLVGCLKEALRIAVCVSIARYLQNSIEAVVTDRRGSENSDIVPKGYSGGGETEPMRAYMADLAAKSARIRAPGLTEPQFSFRQIAMLYGAAL